MASGRWESAEQEDSISTPRRYNSERNELNSYNSQQGDNADDIITEVRKSGKFNKSLLGEDHDATQVCNGRIKFLQLFKLGLAVVIKSAYCKIHFIANRVSVNLPKCSTLPL